MGTTPEYTMLLGHNLPYCLNVIHHHFIFTGDVLFSVLSLFLRCARHWAEFRNTVIKDLDFSLFVFREALII